MGSQIIEVATSSNIRLHAPRQVFTVIIQVAWRLCKTYLYVDDISYFSFFNQLAYFLEVWQIAAVVGYKARYSRFLRNTVNAGTVLVTGGHRFFDINRFPGFHGHNGESSV